MSGRPTARAGATVEDAAEVLATLGLEEAAEFPRQAIEAVETDGALFAPGDPAAHLYVLPASQAVPSPVELFIEREDSGRAGVIDRVVDGVFGEIEFVGRDESGSFPDRALGARVLRPTRLLRLPYSTLLLCETAMLSRIDRRLAGLATERYRALAQAMDASRTSNRGAGLAELLVRLAEDAGVREGGGLRVTVRKTQQDLADEVGLTREVVNGYLRDWSKAGWITLDQGGLVVRAIDRLKQFVELSRRRTRITHDRLLKRIDAALGGGDTFRARNLAIEALRFFPNSAELQFRASLASVRVGAHEEAGALVSGFGFDGSVEPSRLRTVLRQRLNNPLARTRSAGDDEELVTDDAEDAGRVQARLDQRLPGLLEDVLALPARQLKEACWAAQDPAAREGYGRAAADAYRRAFGATGRSYTGINAAALAFCFGETDAADLARRTLERVSGAGYWAEVTRGEALALLGRPDEAVAAFAKAAGTADAEPGAIASTRLQLVRLEPFLPLAGRLLGALPQYGVAALTGHMMHAQDLDGAGQIEADRQLAEVAAREIAGARIRFAYGALAAGADIVLAEAVLAARGHHHAVLPFRVEDFFAVSVRPCLVSGGPDWQTRAMRALAESRGLSVVARQRLEELPKGEVDETIRIANRHAVGLALLKADELVTRPMLIAVHDQRPSASVAGTAHLVEMCRSKGLEVLTIPCPWKRRPPKLRVPDRALPHEPVLFAWSGEESREGTARSDADERLDGLGDLLRRVLGRTDMVPRITRGADVGFAVPFGSTRETLSAARALAASRRVPLRLVCSFGAIRRASGAVSADRAAQLEGADHISDLPTDYIVATEAFAAESRLEDGLRFHPIGRLSPSRTPGRQAVLASAPLYQPLEQSGED